MPDNTRFTLERLGDDWLHLVDQQGEFTPVTIDFMDAYYRARGGSEHLPKTLRGMAGAHVADATAGWARDAWLLAYRGFRITLIEREPLLFALLAQGIARAQATPAIAAIAARLDVLHADSSDHLRHNGYDAVYLDPMYPARDKKSKVKKDMQILHALLADTPGNHDALLASARHAARERVIVKRPQGAPHLADATPDYQIHAPNTRFDIYKTT
ncbi:MAG: class I SAM-dependent methyltransferase [Cardiobacteriaceae bacterium]|nr:class I SAM-dependent methyltransferase [Cardiobacteriaceae bacterium]